jgi:hypothetical protein
MCDAVLYVKGSALMCHLQDEEEEIRVEVNILKRFGAHENLTTFYGAFLVPVRLPKWLVLTNSTMTDLNCRLMPTARSGSLWISSGW